MAAEGDLLAEHGEMVRAVAKTIAYECEIKGDIADLIGWGFQGLFEARARYEAGSATPFQAFAYYRVRGAILDGVRKLSNIPRRTLDTCKRRARVDDVAEGAYPEERDEDSPDDAGVDPLAAVVDELLGVLAATFVATAAADSERRGATPEEALITEEQVARVRAALEALPERDLMVLRAIYYEERTLEDIGQQLGVTRSMISRIHTGAIALLRKRLG